MNPEQARTSGSWDWWPLARLLITGAVLGLAAHYWWGWTPDLRGLARKPREVFEVLSLFTLISFALAHLYVMFLAFPVYGGQAPVLYGLLRPFVRGPGPRTNWREFEIS